MITREGYSKDAGIMPEGIAVTWGREMLLEKGVRSFLRYFEKVMCHEDETWIQFATKAPKHDILYVYIIVLNRLLYRCYYAGFEEGECEMYGADGSSQIINRPRILLAGPFERCPFKRTLKGFQGFRYTTKLF